MLYAIVVENLSEINWKTRLYSAFTIDKNERVCKEKEKRKDIYSWFGYKMTYLYNLYIYTHTQKNADNYIWNAKNLSAHLDLSCLWWYLSNWINSFLWRSFSIGFDFEFNSNQIYTHTYRSWIANNDNVMLLIWYSNPFWNHILNWIWCQFSLYLCVSLIDKSVTVFFPLSIILIWPLFKNSIPLVNYYWSINDEPFNLHISFSSHNWCEVVDWIWQWHSLISSKLCPFKYELNCVGAWHQQW